MNLQQFADLERALLAAGLQPGRIQAGGLMRCPVEGDKHGKKSGAYRLFADAHPRCWWQNWKTGETGVWSAAGAKQLTAADIAATRHLIERAQAEACAERQRQWASQAEKLARLWEQAIPITADCPAGRYLASRDLQLPQTDTLRWTPRLDYWHAGQVRILPAMLAAVTDPAGELVALHRTYLTEHGSKAPVPCPKKLSRTAGSLRGASIKLGQPALRPDGRMGLGVAEGIETALAARQLGQVPVWPCVAANMLEQFEPPASVQNLYIFADNDASGTGQRVAHNLAKRMAARGIEARVLLPEQEGMDWADVLEARRA